MGRHGIDGKWACVAEPRVRVGLGRRIDVAALGVGDHEQAGGRRIGNEPFQLGHARRAMALEERDLGLDHGNGAGERLDT